MPLEAVGAYSQVAGLFLKNNAYLLVVEHIFLLYNDQSTLEVHVSSFHMHNYIYLYTDLITKNLFEGKMTTFEEP